MTTPAIGVVVGTYRRPRLLAEALESVAAQTLPAARILVCDDASGDETEAVVRAFAAASPIPTLFCSQDHTGHPGRNRNQALPHLDGLDLVAFLDDDDRWLPEKLARQVERLAGGDVDLLGSGIEAEDQEGRVVRTYRPRSGPISLRDLARQNPLATSSVIMEAGLYRSLGGFSEHPHLIGWGDDYDLWLRAAAEGARVQNLPEALVVYREGQGIAARLGASHRWRAENMLVIANNLPDRHDTRDARRILTGRRFAELAEGDLEEGLRGPAVRHAFRAVMINPGRPSLATFVHALRGTPLNTG